MTMTMAKLLESAFSIRFGGHGDPSESKSEPFRFGGRLKSKFAGSGVPEMVRCSSESDELDSLSSSVRAVALSSSGSQARRSPPRSIFAGYWSSHPSPAVGVGETADGGSVAPEREPEREPEPEREQEEETRMRLHAVAATLHKFAPPAAVVTAAALPPWPWEDAVVRPSPPSSPSQGPPRAPRRQILPPPPPATAISSSLLQPRRPTLANTGPPPHSRSTPALLGRGRRNRRSCLRPSRYSCPAIGAPTPLHHGLRNEGRAALAKSVVFCTEVAVFEFAVPPKPRRGAGGDWARHFAAAEDREALCFEGRTGARRE